ncbi:hypothetical protein [Janthinobacterium lividum]|uniref:hypothetical protein n=1 Tax=Janthinobacterium lividum TaxID=29581 RepID=UPI0015960BD7|nr:hypothetical protein [Janthinobacterium lividum]QKY08911.1 hypothetical protein G8765_14885 [Janthinobacterium lividum]
MIKLTDLQSFRAVVDDLAQAYDFDIDRASRDYSWIRITPEHRFLVIAGESTGGAFLAYGDGDFDQMPILYVTSEGQAGKVASNLSEWLAIVVAVPYWQDLLHFSGGGDLAEMRRTAELVNGRYAEEEEEEEEVANSARTHLMKVLAMQEISDPIAVFHRNVAATDCTVVAADGWRYESLFNKFRSDDLRS